MNQLMRYVADAKKAVVSLVGVLIVLASMNLPDPYQRYITAALAILTPISVWAASNAAAPALDDPDATDTGDLY